MTVEGVITEAVVNVVAKSSNLFTVLKPSMQRNYGSMAIFLYLMSFQTERNQIAQPDNRSKTQSSE